MRRVVVLYGHPTDADHFRHYFEETHLRPAAKLPGLKASRHSFDLVGKGLHVGRRITTHEKTSDMRKGILHLVIGTALAMALTASSAYAQKKYDTGATDTEIKLGQTNPSLNRQADST